MVGSMNINDFCYMQKGTKLGDLTAENAQLIAPIWQHNGKFERALLILHGFYSTPAVYRFLLPLIKKNYDAILAPALPGHGDSIEAFSHVQAKQWLTCAEQEYLKLADKFTKVDVMGLSLGGLLGIYLAQNFNFNHLYLLAPALNLYFPIKITLKLIKLVQWFKIDKIPALGADVYSAIHSDIVYKKIPLTAIVELFSLCQQFQFTPPKCPADLFIGRHDKVVNSKKVVARFKKSNNVKIHWLDNSAHILPIDGDLETIAKVISAKNC